MEDIVYKDMISQEKDHWWFKARREILDDYLHKLQLPQNANILEIGCGTGGNIPILKKYGNVKAIEMDEFAIGYAKHTGAEIRQGYLPENFPYDEKFDLICMFDVLEHIEKDEETLKVINNFLKPSGILFITVPAYQWLYGSHDKLLQHKRRYSKSDLVQKLNSHKFKITKISFFNTLLFPLVLVARVLDIIGNSDTSTGYGTPNKLLNSLFYNIFKSEKKPLQYINFPFGTSLIVISRRINKEDNEISH